MTLLVPWIVFPLILGALSLGCGLVLDRASGGRISGPLLLPAGLAVITVVAGFTTAWEPSARATVPVIVGIAVLGLGLWARGARIGLDRYTTACALVAFLAVGAPVLVSGEATFTGYVKLDDTATFLALTDRVLEHGRDVDGLAPSSYEATLAVNLAQGYPTGALLPLGVGSRLVGSDPAWVYQPYLAFLAAMLASSLYFLAGTVLQRRPARALVAALASQPALLYGFALWGGVKELYAAGALALVAATFSFAREGPRSALVPGVAVAATMLALSPGAAVWLLPGIAFLLVARTPRGRAGTLVAAVVAIALALPALLEAARFLRGDNLASFRDTSELGNLFRPLDPFQLLGVWPSGDFRAAPSEPKITAVLIAVALGAAIVGLLVSLRREATPLLLYAASCAVGAVAISALGSPWLEAKAFAVASPAILLIALVGAVRLVESKRLEALIVLAVLSGGVLASNALAYRDASLAPRAQLRELEQIGRQFAGSAPALMTEYQPYGVRYFLRLLEAEGASELRRRAIPLREGRLLRKGEVADIDAFAPRTILAFRTLVLLRSPTASRPPTPYELAWSGRFYEVWLRAARPIVLAHLPLGDTSSARSPAPCPDVLRLATDARRWGGLIAASRGDSSSPIYVSPMRARALCGRSLDWIEVVRT